MKLSFTQNSVRNCMAVVAIFLIGLSVSIFKMSAFGIDPFQCFMAGMGNLLSFLPFGVMYTMVSILQFVAMYIWGRKYIGFGTVLNIATLGTIIEYTGRFLVFLFGTELTLIGRVFLFAFGITLLMFSAALYFTADKGVSTYDFVALTMADKKIMPFRLCRIMTDSICVLFGLVCGIGFGAGVGVGTIITAFFMGPLIALFREKLTDPFLAKFPKEAPVTK